MNENSIHILTRALIIDEDHVILSYDPRQNPYHYYELGKKFYYLPGGHVSYNESLERSLIREIKEEMNSEAIIEKFLGVIEHAWSFEGDEVCCHTHEINHIFKVIIPHFRFKDLIPQNEKDVAFE